MDSGYRAITEDEGAIVKAGDQFKPKSPVYGRIWQCVV